MTIPTTALILFSLILLVPIAMAFSGLLATGLSVMVQASTPTKREQPLPVKTGPSVAEVTQKLEQTMKTSKVA